MKFRIVLALLAAGASAPAMAEPGAAGAAQDLLTYMLHHHRPLDTKPSKPSTSESIDEATPHGKPAAPPCKDQGCTPPDAGP